MTSAGLVAALTASGGTESAGFLNDIVEQLWPNICVAAAEMTKSIVEPMFATMLPAPANSLKFTKIDLGTEPLKLSNVDVHKTPGGAIKLDLDLDWDGLCNITLDGQMMPSVGIKELKLSGRLSILLGPLTNVIPLIGAAQVAFINPPTLTLRYTDAGAIANFGFIDAQIRGILQSIMASMLVLPNRFLVKLDVTNDWFKTYQPPLGIIRFTIESATNIGEDKGKKGFFKKLIHDVPDSYATVTLGEKFKTKSTENTRDPKWDETHDFLLSDHDQKIFVEIWDSDTTSDDLMGAASVAVRDILLQGGTHVLALVHGGNEVEGRVKVHGKFHEFVADPASLSSQEPGTHGLLTILIAGVKNIKGDRTKLKPSVAVKWGAAAFRTSIQSDSPGTDVQNPNYDVAFTVPLTSSVTVSGSEPLRITLMDGETEVGSAQVSLDTVLAAPDLTFSKFHVLEDGATIRAAVIIRGTKLVQ